MLLWRRCLIAPPLLHSGRAALSRQPLRNFCTPAQTTPSYRAENFQYASLLAATYLGIGVWQSRESETKPVEPQVTGAPPLAAAPPPSIAAHTQLEQLLGEIRATRAEVAELRPQVQMHKILGEIRESRAEVKEMGDRLRGGAAVRPVVVCGPSGVGKGTLIAMLVEDFHGKIGFSVSHTTRQPRPGEQDGKHYHFTKKETMQQMIANGEFLEHASVHGNFYGTSKAAVKHVLDQKKVCILDIDVQGAQQVKDSSIDALFLFIMPPSLQQLEQRLRGRGTEAEAQIRKRLAAAGKEIAKTEEPGFFDALIVNDDLKRAYGEFKSYLPCTN